MIIMYFCTLVLILLFSLVQCQFQEAYVATDKGTVTGIKLFTVPEKIPYYLFAGIPYAKPPVESLRFKPPAEVLKWNGIRPLKLLPICHQWIVSNAVSKFFGVEDCLYINILTPTLKDNARLPVAVCIHDGNFQYGSSYGCIGNNFIEKNIVFVSFNYRLGIFGFLSAADDVLPGNYGLKDQLAALKWIRKNIASFGGDVNKITIMGQGAGAISVHMHMLSAASTGLFHSAISQSGTALVPWAVIPHNEARSRLQRVANLLKCPNNSSEDLLRCLQKKKVNDIGEIQPLLGDWEIEPSVIFAPVVEYSSSHDAILTKHPLYSTEINKVPWILGFNSGEGAVKYTGYFQKRRNIITKLIKEIDQALPVALRYKYSADEEDLLSITERIKNFYLKNNMSEIDSHDFVNMFGDSWIAYGILKTLKTYSGTKYCYYYDHLMSEKTRNPIDLTKYKNMSFVSHGDELPMLYAVPWMKEFPVEDVVVSSRIVKFWSNFIIFGNPNDPDELIWQRSEVSECLHITTNSDNMVENIIEDRFEFWDSLPITSKFNITADIYFKDEL